MQFSLAELNPKRYTSPSGAYALYVDPQDRYGGGGARYRLTRKGVVVWEGNHPFTLWEAGVTDTGIVGGYAYSHGEDGWARSRERAIARDHGTFDIIILDARGKERLHQKIKRVESRFLHTSPQPLAEGMLLDGTQERLIVRVADPDLNRGVEEWRIFSLSTGRELRRLTPKTGMPAFTAARYIIDARSVTGTSLVLLHWWCYGDDGSLGARFTLLHLERVSAKPVWVLDLPRDYTIPRKEDAQDRLRDTIRKSGAILSTATAQQFTLHFVAAKQRVTFHVAPAPGHTWRVTKAQSVPYVAPTMPMGPRVPTISLKLRDRLDLLASQSETPASRLIQRPEALIAAGPGRLAFVRQNDKPALVVVTEQGTLVYELALTNASLGSKLVWQGESRFILFCERRADEYRKNFTEAYRMDAQTNTVNLIAGFRCPSIDAVAPFPGGDGFAMLATIHERYSMSDVVYVYDREVRRVWSLTNDGGYSPNDGPEKLFSPESLTVLRDGTVAVLDNINKSVKFYDRNGKYQRTLKLQTTWKREPNYPTDLVAAPDGGFLIHDFNGTPSVVWMKNDGTVIRSFSPRYDSNKPIESPGFCIAASGRLWVNDGYSLLGLDATGRATTRLGDKPDANRLENISEIAVQQGGRILVRDQRTGAVHVLDAKGRRLHLCVPRSGATEAPDLMNDRQIHLGPNETFAINDDWFGDDGQRRAKPTGFRTAQERASTIQRRPDRSWKGWVRQSVVAPNGALAIFDEPQTSDAPGFISLYSAANVPERMIPVPRLLGFVPAIAYDGKHVILPGNGWVYAYRANGQPLWRFAVPLAPGEARKPAEERYYQPFLTEAGKTLCLFDGIRFLYRYALP